MATKAQHEAIVLNQIRKFKGFSIFWITENQHRASAAMRLQGKGKIRCKERSKFHQYPWCVYKIVKEEV